MTDFEISPGYGLGKLAIEDCPQEPMVLLKKWLEEAKKEKIKDYNAMALSTCVDNSPNCRFVLCKKVEADSLIFFTNYLSPKGQELAKNPQVHIAFFWPQLERQIRLWGRCRKLAGALCDDYFYQRDKNSQIALPFPNRASPFPPGPT